MRIHVDASAIDTLAQAFGKFPELARQEMARFMHEATQFLQGEVIERTPVVTGALRDSVIPHVQEVPGGALGVVGTALNYAVPVELGTKPHEIRARNGKALHFLWGGREIAVKSVKHPGSQGAFMFRNALSANPGELARQLELTVQRLRARLAGVAT